LSIGSDYDNPWINVTSGMNRLVMANPMLKTTNK
jgi:hypothetical protein